MLQLRDLYALGHKLGQVQLGTTYLCTELATGTALAASPSPSTSCSPPSPEDVDDVHRKI